MVRYLSTYKLLEFSETFGALKLFRFIGGPPAPMSLAMRTQAVQFFSKLSMLFIRMSLLLVIFI
jgi:hypothetical protein